MKTKNILGLVAIVAVAVAMAFNVTVSNKKTDTASLLALRNVEALANENTPPQSPDVWYRFGVWTELKYPATTHKVEVDIIVRGVKVGVTVEYHTTPAYTVWDCIGWVGRC